MNNISRGNRYSTSVQVTSPTPNQRLRCRLPHLTMELSWLFPLRVLHHLPRAASWLTPRQTDCPVSFPHSPCVRERPICLEALHHSYCVSDSGRSDSEQVFTQPQKLLSFLAISGWNPLTVARRRTPASRDSFQGTDQFMPFALFTTLRETC